MIYAVRPGRRTSPALSQTSEMLAFSVSTFLAILVVLNLIGMTIAAYMILKRK